MSIVEDNRVNLGPHPQYPKSVKAGIPKLPDSKPGWKKIPISELFDVVIRPVYMEDETVYNLVTVKRSRGGITKREKLPGRKISVKSQFYVEGGDFLISKRQIVHGACGFVPEELSGSIVSNEYSVLRCKDTILPEFLNYLMHTPYFQQTCFHSSIGIHVEKMIFKLEEWFKWNLYVPPKSEQKKIANFLSSIDDKFNQLVRKHELLETYKRGLMQQLFTKAIRFKQDDGSDFPDWKEKKLGKVSDVRDGTHDTPKYKAEGFPLVTSRNLLKDGTLSFENINYISERDYIEINNRSNVDIGDILFGMIGTIGNPVLVRESNFAIKNVALIKETDFLKNSYLIQYLNSQIVKRQFYEKNTGGTQKFIALGVIRDLSILLPCIDEQIKIAASLASFDHKISLVSQKIKQIKDFKKGLRQKVFE